MIITLNGREKEIPSEYKSLNYDNVVVLGFGPPGYDEGNAYTVVWSVRGKDIGGSLVQGGPSVKLRKGMNFTCVQTTKS